MSNYRYFAANQNGVTHKALSAMEAAGDEITKALNQIDQLSDPVDVVRFVTANQLRAVALLPTEQRPRNQAVSVFVQLCKHPTGANAGFVNSMIGKRFSIYCQSERIVNPEALPFFQTIMNNLSGLGTDPNIAVDICKAAEAAGRGHDDPARSVIEIGGQKIYPEARMVFGTWVIQMPAYIDHFKNDFTPPDCREMQEEELAELMKPIGNLREFKQSHITAQQRLAALPQIVFS